MSWNTGRRSSRAHELESAMEIPTAAVLGVGSAQAVVSCRLVAVLCLLLTGAPSLATIGGTWNSVGPAPATGGDVDNIVPDDEVAGAIRVVLPHPSNPDILHVGAVNGGVWRTMNARAVKPTWEELTVGQTSLSIGDLDRDPTDLSHQTLVAGIGNFSSYGTSGPRRGILRTTDGGATWTELDGGGRLRGFDISGVASRGATLVISSAFALPNLFANVGVFRSTDTGQTWTQVSVGDGSATGLPGGQADLLARDPSDPTRLFTSIVFAGGLGGSDGIYRSEDTGATWTKVSNAAMDAEIDASGNTNVRIAVGLSNQVFAAISGGNGCIGGLFRSADGGDTWVVLDTPDVHNSCQGSLHLSIAADPTDADIVYIGGDLFNRFEISGFAAGGRLVRCDAAASPGSQCVFLSSGSTPDGGGTASASETHADSRSMAFDAQGDLIEGDDGGVYRRTSPRTNTGDWFSLNGDLSVTEGHSAAYDPVADIVLVGAQDTGTLAQETSGGRRFFTVDVADGGDLAIDATSSPGLSVRYSSEQFLGLFRREVYDADNNFVSRTFPPHTPEGADPVCATLFTTPIALHRSDPDRLIFGCGNHVYESDNQGQSIRVVGNGVRVSSGGADAIAYGAASEAGWLYVGGRQGGGGFDRVFVRATLAGALEESLSYPGRGSGRAVQAIVLIPDSGARAFAADTRTVYRTLNGGNSWLDISGNLPSFDPATPDEQVPFVRSLAYLANDVEDALLAGTSNGVYIALESTGFTVWQPLGSGLANGAIYELDYDATDDVILASAFGRGAWTLAGPATDPAFFGIFADGFESGDVSAWSAATSP